MLDYLHMLVALRICCDELGYPACEAQYGSVEEYEQETGLKVQDALRMLQQTPN